MRSGVSISYSDNYQILGGSITAERGNVRSHAASAVRSYTNSNKRAQTGSSIHPHSFGRQNSLQQVSKERLGSQRSTCAVLHTYHAVQAR